jgi:SpoU rRNA methylase family enzyme
LTRVTRRAIIRMHCTVESKCFTTREIDMSELAAYAVEQDVEETFEANIVELSIGELASVGGGLCEPGSIIIEK